MALAFVITTVHAPTAGVRALAHGAVQRQAKVFVVGDLKTPGGWACSGAHYLSPELQGELDFKVARELPFHSYTRKMLGYLVAAREGAQWIRETDDDNTPYTAFFASVPEMFTCRAPDGEQLWANPYAYFTDRAVWPRGFPLTNVNKNLGGSSSTSTVSVQAPFILQAVADGDPDVDAIYRLTAPDTSDITFATKEPLALPSGVWCPFNSQATTWPRELFALMYLPTTCTFRMTDIWRSFVVQRMLPGLGATLVFTSATVHQDRNEHNLLSDFEQEVPGYLGTEQIRAVLDATPIKGGASNVLSDLETLYRALIDAGFLTSEELPVLTAWLNDVRGLGLAS